jgi:hypothetical protein
MLEPEEPLEPAHLLEAPSRDNDKDIQSNIDE